MRFMVIVKGNADSEAGKLPSENELVEMGKFNESLIKAGIMLAGEGLHASSSGARIRFNSGKAPTIIDGPFTESKELIAGFWIIQAKSLQEAIEWFRNCPPEVGELEVRQIFESTDFEPVIQTDAGRAVLEAEDRFREQAAAKNT